MGRDRIESKSPEETIALGQQLGENLKPNSILCLSGELGAGKTTLVKGIVLGATGILPEEVCSPTFVYLNVYPNNLKDGHLDNANSSACLGIYGNKSSKPVYHFDLYRLGDPDEFLSMGFDEYFFQKGLCCIEWSERIEGILPPHCLRITLSHVDENCRLIELKRNLFFRNGIT